MWHSNPQAVSTLNPGPAFATFSSVRCPVAAVPRAIHWVLTTPESCLSQFWMPEAGIQVLVGSTSPLGSGGGAFLGGLPPQALGEGPSGSWQFQGLLSCGCVPPAWASFVPMETPVTSSEGPTVPQNDCVVTNYTAAAPFPGKVTLRGLRKDVGSGGTLRLGCNGSRFR